MKILHTADWHLGKRLDGFSRMEEQREVLQEICDVADTEKVDAVVIAGDLFDTINPPVEAIELFYTTLKRLTNNGKRAIIAIAGNHDSPDRIESPDVLARECGIIFSGYPNTEVRPFKLESGIEVLNSEQGFIELSIPSCSEPLRVLLTPYANEARLRTFLGYENTEEELREVLADRWKILSDKYCDEKGVNILATHLFMVGRGEVPPDEPDAEKPILHVGGAQVVYTDNIPNNIQYTALGHLHRKQLMRRDGRVAAYSGSPLSYSFAEANQEKCVMIVDVKAGGEACVSEFPLNMGRKLLRYRAEGIEEAVSWLNDNSEALVELTLVSDTFLASEDRKKLHEVHNGIITLIPEVKNKESLLHSGKSTIDLSQSMEDLFVEYFTYSKGQAPNESITNLFKEVLAEN